MTGRPSSYTDTIANRICDALAQGKALKAICRGKGMPTPTTVRRWTESNESFRARFARAREAQADYWAEEIVTIADTDPDPQRARNRIDARKWIAAKLRPKRWGDKVQAEITGADGGDLSFAIKLVRPESPQIPHDDTAALPPPDTTD